MMFQAKVYEEAQRSLGRSLLRRGELERLEAEVEPEYWPVIVDVSPIPPSEIPRSFLFDCVLAALLVIAILVTMYLFSTF